MSHFLRSRNAPDAPEGRYPKDARSEALEPVACCEQLVILYPEPRCALVHSGAYQLLVATILSAQCTDARVNLVTPALFDRYPTPKALAKSEPAELEALIRSTGFFRAKAKNLRAMAATIVDDHGGKVPTDLDALTALPGVGRKTAHVVLRHRRSRSPRALWSTPTSKRLAFRLGLTTERDPKRIERDLAAIVPRRHWVDFSHRLIEHGRKVCVARKPRCTACTLATICPKNGVANG